MTAVPVPVAAGAEAEVAAAGLVVWQHGVGVGLAFGGVGGGDGVDYGLGFFVADFWERGGGVSLWEGIWEGNWIKERRTLVVVDDVAQVVAAAVVGFAHAHGVVGEVDVAVVAEDCGMG